MASSSSLSLSPPLPSSPRSQSWLHDVFPSFHGTDVRKNILSHILKEFITKGISTFIDNEIQRGESIGPELKRAIKESKIAIVLLSKNYASSSWCLDELVEIMNKVLGQKVLTIFYDVDPSDVKKQTGDFGKVFEKTCLGKTKEKIETWRKALEGVATIAGYHSRNWDTESDMVEKIASDICGILNSLAPSPDLDLLIGMGDHIKRLQQLLRLDLVDEVRMIGIWGPPGIGKSTIAHSLFIKLSNSFPLSAIIVDIRGRYARFCLDEGNAQRKLQKKMLSKMLKQKDIIVTHLGVAQERLKHRKVLLVVDDVDQLAQLEALAGHTLWFGPGSRIIISTEDRGLLNAHGMISDIYQVPYPSSSEALQMFCKYAFGQKFPKDGFRELTHEIVHRTGNLPLGLKVMGSHFKRLESTEEWFMELPRVTSLDQKIERILRFSYDALSREDKDIFIHIACFFNDQTFTNMEVVGHLVKRCPNVRRGLDVLVEKSLISMNYLGMIVMHKLLAQLGKEIVREQTEQKREFLYNDYDIRELLLNDPTTITTRSFIGISSKYNMFWANISERAFQGMSKLQFLRLSSGSGDHIASFSGLIKYISPKLQLLHWLHSPMTCLPFSINLENLVQIKMPFSKLEKLWDGNKLLQNLKWVDLSYSLNLKELPNLSTATSLQILDLSYCFSLVELPFSIGRAINLQILDLRFCSSLVELPFSIYTKNLQKFDLRGCSSLRKLPFSIGHAKNLQKLYLNGCSSLVELPSSIGHAANLRELNLFGCSSLVKLPSFGKATSLQKLNLRHCSSLVELPSSIGNAINLKVRGSSKQHQLRISHRTQDSESFSCRDEDSDEERSSHMYWGSNKRLRLE